MDYHGNHYFTDVEISDCFQQEGLMCHSIEMNHMLDNNYTTTQA